MNILLLYVTFRVFGGDAVTKIINSTDDNQNNNIEIIMRFVIHQLFIILYCENSKHSYAESVTRSGNVNICAQVLKPTECHPRQMKIEII